MKEPIPNYREIIYSSDYNRMLSGAAIYKEFEKEQRIKTAYFKRNYLPRLPGDKSVKILDIGCGRGEQLLACKEFGYVNIEGIDLSPSNVEFCRSNGLKCKEISLAEFLNDAENLYDVIFFSDIIEHLSKQEVIEALFHMRWALKPGGLLIVKTPNAANPYVSGSGRYICFDHEIGFTANSMRQILSTCGYQNVVVKGVDIYSPFGVLGWVAKGLAKLICFRLYLMSVLFGRKSVKIFEKDIVAFAYKE